MPAKQVTIQNRPTVLNTGEYTGELRWDEVRAGRDLHVIDGLTVTKMSNEGGDYATVLGTLCVASGQHSWNVYINHVEDSNLFIGAWGCFFFLGQARAGRLPGGRVWVTAQRERPWGAQMTLHAGGTPAAPHPAALCLSLAPCFPRCCSPWTPPPRAEGLQASRWAATT